MKRRAHEVRQGFFGGVNFAVSQDTVNPNELLKCENARVLPSGAVQRRTGISKLHVITLGPPEHAYLPSFRPHSFRVRRPSAKLRCGA